MSKIFCPASDEEVFEKVRRNMPWPGIVAFLAASTVAGPAALVGVFGLAGKGIKDILDLKNMDYSKLKLLDYSFFVDKNQSTSQIAEACFKMIFPNINDVKKLAKKFIKDSNL